jgi:hypothetical protein
MVMVPKTYAGTTGGVEAEARADHAVGEQSPLADIAILACLKLTDEHDLLAGHVDGRAKKRPSI